MRWLALPLATMSAAALLAAAQNVEPSGEAARLEGFSRPDGTNYFALSLRAIAARRPARAELVVLFSSAASQAGGYRQKALAAVEATLARLEPGDRVKIMAYDLHAVPITKGFVAPNGPGGGPRDGRLARAGAAGGRRSGERPAGGGGELPRAIQRPPAPSCCVGEGTSRANAMGPEQFEQLVSSLVASGLRCSATGSARGSTSGMLRALAGRTGGHA